MSDSAAGCALCMILAIVFPLYLVYLIARTTDNYPIANATIINTTQANFSDFNNNLTWTS